MEGILNVLLILQFIYSSYSQSPQSILEDNSLCICDLTVNSCDVNCCCDPKCDASIKKQFSVCLDETDPKTFDRVCNYQKKTYNKTTKDVKLEDIKSSGGLCIYSSNNERMNYYKKQDIITDLNQLNTIIQNQDDAISSSSPTTVYPTEIQNVSNNDQYPSGFKLSGNIGYEIGKPVMVAEQVGSNLILNTNNMKWWTITSSGECTSSVINQESVLFGTNIISGCKLTFDPSKNCAKLIQEMKLYLGTDKFNNSRIASYAKVNLTNLPDWVNIIKSSTTQSLGGSGSCVAVIGHKFNVLYARIGHDLYPHNKIVAVQYEEITKNFNLSTAKSEFVRTTVNFIDVSTVKERVYKLSPFLNIRLPYDFFFPIYNP